ncbi:MAG: aspartate--tRNA(Asn) ligase [Candidatus Nanoarchaeia archaeon]|nr:aspartate--tRNA(Asn) ligase [Candidatus Nanoarchaeia archaeon]
MLEKRKPINELLKKTQKNVVAAGWVEKVKLMGNSLAFITLRDRTGKIQLIAKKDFKNFDLIKDLTNESVIIVNGDVQESKQKSGEPELIINELEISSLAYTPLPVDIFGGTTGLDKRLDHRYLDTRNPKINAIFTIRSKIFKAAVDFFDKEGFININTPKLTGMGVESGAELFVVDYFGRPAYLAQSPQVYKQLGVIAGFERVYEIAPVFRAEKSHTTRHLTEFTGIDMEMGFIESEQDVIDVIEKLFQFIIQEVNKNCKEELKLLDVKLTIPKKMVRINMDEAKEILKQNKKILKEDDDLDAEAETILGDYFNKKGSEFVFVCNYPWAKRPFYHMKPVDDPRGTKSFDLLWNGVEIATGAQREHRLEIIEKQAKEKGIKLDNVYKEIFKYGCPPHGGTGLGLDRMTQRLLKIANVKETVLLPRDPERLNP